ncbi:MAG: hypothetical protein HOA28_01365 [Euryarchaeota archaeon]|nr:hypothetical protein [Euryarchaeota archaeon]
MKIAFFLSLIIIVGSLSGCIEEKSELIESEEIAPAPERISFSSPIMGDDSNNTALDLQEYVSEGPVLLIWVAAGCRGCHSWTDMISDEVESGNITNSSVLSIHRYSSFESPSYVEESYGKNSSNPVSWTLALPQENTPVINLDTGQESQYSIYDSFGNPSTPTLQIMDETGKLIWSSKTYWPTSEIVDEIKNILN